MAHLFHFTPKYGWGSWSGGNTEQHGYGGGIQQQFYSMLIFTSFSISLWFFNLFPLISSSFFPSILLLFSLFLFSNSFFFLPSILFFFPSPYPSFLHLSYRPYSSFLILLFLFILASPVLSLLSSSFFFSSYFLFSFCFFFSVLTVHSDFEKLRLCTLKCRFD